MTSKWLSLILSVALVGCGVGTSEQGSGTTADRATTTTEQGASASSSTTVASTSTGSTATTTAATTTTMEEALVLRSDGLGVASFGEPAEEVMAALIELLGPPEWEEVQVSADTDLSVRWGEDGAEVLYLQFTYWDYFDAAPDPPQPMPEGPVFHYYLTRSDLLATEAGISVGSTVGDLQSAYPNVRFTSFCAEPIREFVLDPSEGWLQLPMWGLLDGDPTDPSTRIAYIGAGWDRSPC